jgi:hypothetical protein
MKTQKYYTVSFFSPGTFFSETSHKDFQELDLKKICAVAKTMKERHNASPYGFVWEYRELPTDLPQIEGYKLEVTPKVIEKSTGIIYITGEIIYSKDLISERDRILKFNLERNYDGVGVINKNSYIFHAGFNEGDMIIGWDGSIIKRGNERDLMNYRAKIRAAN